MTRHFIRQFARRNVQVARRLRPLNPVLVGAGLEAYFAPLQALEAGDYVGRDRLIGMADMRRAIGLGDRCRQIIGFSQRPAL
jgi:hypothetical protein